ncbi:MAG: hypothetical protein M5R36_23720 [Deltaproteobacteria bacterium]|nr:hypothetical protein [Deltaproteobacteria bacterium]
MWDVVSLAKRAAGTSVMPDSNFVRSNPFVLAGSWALRHIAEKYQTLAAIQLPFLAILLLSVAMIAWRYGGRSAATLAPWVALAGPMTVGLAVHLDDLLPLQAMASAAVACFAWSDRPRRTKLVWLAVLPLAAGVLLADWFSNGILMMLAVGGAAAGVLMFQWIESRRAAGARPWSQIAGAAFSFAGAVAVLWPSLQWRYITGEATDPRFSAYAPSSDFVGAVTAFPDAWFRFHAGPVMAGWTLVALAAALTFTKNRARFIPGLTWLILPMIVMAMFGKRYDYYVAAAIPATYVLLAVAVTAWTPAVLRRAAAVLCVASLAAAWGWQATRRVSLADVPAEPERFHLRPYPYLYSPKSEVLFEVPIWPDLERYKELGAMGEWIAETCAPHRRAVLFVSYLGFERDTSFDIWHDDNRVAFDIWHRHPDLVVGDIRRGPFPDAPPCLVTYCPPWRDSRSPCTLDGELADFRDRAIRANFFRTRHRRTPGPDGRACGARRAAGVFRIGNDVFVI